MKIAFTGGSFVTGKATLFIHPDEIARVRAEMGIPNTPLGEPVAKLVTKPKPKPKPRKKIHPSGFLF